ncbi:OstA-like protein [Dinghuibacter silviterrae]|uniref:OstA-like protein n=1 Tax=Dinghuibacter silviterrae TaxID=1539049 RepID=A0A4R8DID3_9BACT|nr:OstA-like protein [Dinghuibacter silviterrae]TDW97054.1 OstA-like protein [Dinghuibacter silviterrae]
MKSGILFIILTLLGVAVFAQQKPAGAPVAPAPDTGTRIVIIIHTDQLEQITRDTVQLEKLIGHDTLREGNTKLYADSMYFNQRANEVEAFGAVHINDNDSINIYSRYLKYYATPKKALLRRDVRMTDGKNVLTTDSLDYDLPTHVGTYIKGGKVVNGTTVVTSINGLYNGNTKDVTFIKNVHLVDPAYKITNDSLTYNMETKVASWEVPTVIVDSTGTIHTKSGYYDLKKNLFYSTKRPVIVDSAGSVTADQLAYDRASGNGEARGNVVYKDTSSNTMLANHVFFNRARKNVLATEKPVLIVLQGKDTTYIAADTFYSGLVRHLRVFRRHLNALGDTSLFPPGSDSSYHPRKKDTSAQLAYEEPTDSLPPGKDSTLRFMMGFHHVRVFSDSLQAKSDSLFYSDVDSVFQFFTKPVVWANKSQITADTMYLYTKHQSPSRLFAFNNGFIIQKVAKDFYNQIQSRTINGYFKDGAIDYMRSKGNAHSIYFAQNDSLQFLGLSLDEADAIDMYFEKRELDHVVYRNGVKGTTIPMGQIQIEQTRLPGFRWLEALRPKSKEELFQ